MKYIFAADIGTTSLKACIFDEELNITASCSKSYNLIAEGEYIEFPAEEYFNIFMSAYNELTNTQSVDGICIDTQGETLIVTDKSGKPLCNAINWLDSRAKAEAQEIEKAFGSRRLYELTGQPEVIAGFPAPKLLWLKKNRPDIFKNIDRIFLLEDYIIYRLTGEFVTERSMQSSSMYLDITSGEYLREMTDFIGIDISLLPKLKESGDLAGYYNGTPVFTGALDQISAMLGAGVTEEGTVSEMTGTTLAVCAVTAAIPKWQEGLKAPCHYLSKGKYAVIMWSGTAGMALEWFRDNFCQGLSFKEIDVLAEKAGAGSDGLTFLPHLTGSVMPKNNPNARGAFSGIELKHTRGHFARSIMEAVACTLRQFLSGLNLSVNEIRSLGGGANSKLWCRIKADITRARVLTLKSKETACQGAALLAFNGLGIKNMPKTTIKDVFEPVLDKNSADFIFDRYIELDNKLN